MAIEDKIKELIAGEFGVKLEEVRPEATFIETLGADSLDLTELIMALEEEFDIEIDDESAQKLLTVQDAIDYIKSRS